MVIIEFSKFKNKLKINPYIGRGLRVPFVREFKTNKGKRAYFIIYEEFKVVLFVGYSNKKNQRKFIEDIFQNLDYFLNIVKNYYNS